MRKIWSFAAVAAALALLIAQPLAGTAATLPKIGRPTISAPAVNLPAANLPAVTTPQVTVPSLTVPSVTTPRVSTPVGPTPTVSTPSVTTPSATAPKVSTPVVKTPSVTTTPSNTPVTTPTPTTRLVKTPNLPGASSPSSSSANGSSSSANGSSSAPAGSSASSSATAPGPSSGTAGRRPASPGAGASSRAATRAGTASSPSSSVGERRSHHGETVSSREAQARAETRRLRNVVARYQGCVGSLDRRSQRLLWLRAGLHGSPRSAPVVARILRVGAGREQLLERMSLLALQTAGRGGCGGSAAVTTVPGPAQLTSTAPWVTASRPTLVATTSGSPSAGPASSGPSSQQHVRATGSRSATPIVITPAATRTAERASAGHDGVSRPEIVLLALLVIAVSLVLMPGVRRRMLPALAGLPPAEGYVGRAGTPPVASVAAASALREAPASPPGPAAPQEPAASRVPAPQSQPEGPAVHRQPVTPPRPRPRTTWVREHATQGALVATVLAGGLVRVLRRGRSR
jgi:hypothetical protein